MNVSLGYLQLIWLTCFQSDVFFFSFCFFIPIIEKVLQSLCFQNEICFDLPVVCGP